LQEGKPCGGGKTCQRRAKKFVKAHKIRLFSRQNDFEKQQGWSAGIPCAQACLIPAEKLRMISELFLQ